MLTGKLLTIIEIKNLTHRYSKRASVAPAISDISLKIQEGSIFGFIGPNGAGKTTTMRILATLLKPTSGDVWVGGCSVRKNPRGVRRQIGYMPDFFGVYNEMKVWEYLDFFAACYDVPTDVPCPRQKRAGLIDDLLQLVDLAHRRNDYVDSLSRGMKQRLCLARTLVHDPQVLILDEPASGLDPRARNEIRDLLRELQAMGKTIFFSSHILLEVAEICTTIGIIEAGRLVTYGNVASLIEEIQTAVGHACSVTRLRHVRIVLAGRPHQARALLQSMPGVLDVVVMQTRSDVLCQLQGKQDHRSELEVSFTGDDEAQTAILTRLIQAGFPVINFREERQVRMDLEDVFMRMTKGIVS